MKDYQLISNIIHDEFIIIDNSLFELVKSHSNFLTSNFLEFLTSKSKKIRSALIILIIKTIFGKITSKQLEICALIELIHNATLIHDDIIDNSDTRRGKNTLNKLFGDKTAVIAGDFLLSLGLNKLAEFNNTRITNLFAKALTNVCSGEINQLFDKNKLITIEKYLQKSQQKTAELFKIGLLSALLIEKQDKYLEFAENFAINFGLAFQIRDDLLNIIGKSANKPLQNDLVDGVFTAPAIYYFEENPNEKIDDHIIAKIQNSCAVIKTKQLLELYTNNSLDLLDSFSDNQYKQALLALCELIKKGEE